MYFSVFLKKNISAMAYLHDNIGPCIDMHHTWYVQYTKKTSYNAATAWKCIFSVDWNIFFFFCRLLVTQGNDISCCC